MATPLYCFLLVSFRAAKTWFKFVPFVSAKSSFGDSGDWWATWVAWGYCHCSICRQLSGAPFSCQALFDAEEVGPTDLYLRSPWPTSYLLLLSDWQIYMWNLRTVPQSSCELVFPIPGSDVAWTWCEPHFFANIQRTGCIGCNLHLFPSMLPIYIYIFTNPCNYLYCSRSGTNEMCLLHGSGTWTCPGRESGSYTFGFALQLAYWDRISFKVRNASPQWFVENDFLFWVLFCKANAPPLLR